MTKLRARDICLIGLSLAAALVFLWAGCEDEEYSKTVKTGINAHAESGFAKAAETATDAPEVAVSAAGSVVDRACELIYEGEFEAAGELVKEASKEAEGQSQFLPGLEQVVGKYQAISQRRQSARQRAYQEQLAELEKIRAEADANDVNDANHVPAVLVAVARVVEFADERQKEKLLSELAAKEAIRDAVEKARGYESKGEWLDAYTSCYWWLVAIDPENEEYRDYAERLIEKANILAAFQDSPCETRKERYVKVTRQMFRRAIDALHFNYVSIIDYREMATKAIRRCELLGEVVGAPSFSRKLGNEEAGSSGEDSNEVFLAPDSKQLAAWSSALAGILAEANQSPAGISRDQFKDVFEKVLAVNSATVELPQSLLITQFADAAFSALDPYTVMVWPRQVQDFEKMMTKEFTGIGIEITKRKGLLMVGSLLPDTPAYNSGLDAGDVIEAVDGLATKDMSLTCAVRRITGPAGTEVRLTVRHPGEKATSDITITRAKIVVSTIRGWQRTEVGKWLYMIDAEEKIGYVRVTDFSAGTAGALEKVLVQLEAEGLRGLILDLRFNSGGLLESAVQVSNKFISEGLIVKTRPRWQAGTHAVAKKKRTHPNYPLVILINNYSASASEIVSGVLQDKVHGRAVLVGERTHGKGSVQGITPYPGEGAQLKYTMAYYHLPSDQKVESQDAMKKLGRKDWGIGPDVEVELTSNELTEMTNLQRDNDVLAKADHSTDGAPLKRHTVEETMAADPQLAIGVLVVKAKLIQEQAKSEKKETVKL